MGDVSFAGTYVWSPVRPMGGSSRWCTGPPPLHRTWFPAAGCEGCMQPHRLQKSLLAGWRWNLKHKKEDFLQTPNVTVDQSKQRERGSKALTCRRVDDLVSLHWSRNWVPRQPEPGVPLV